MQELRWLMRGGLATALLLTACGDDDGGGGAPSTQTESATGGEPTQTASDTDPMESADGTESSGQTSAAETGTTTDDDDGPQPAGPDNAIDPAVAGPYPVGVITLEFDDPAREGGRPLITEIWYPATDDAIGMDTVTYQVDDIFRPDALEVLGNELGSELPTTAVRDAPMRVDSGPFPVIFFSHGSGGIRMQSTYYTVDLASHGYVVVSTDHVGNTLSDIIVDGDLETAALLQSFADRPMDLSFIREELELMEPDAPLAEIMDFDRVGVTGHSFGALTSLRWMGLGADVDAVVAQATPGMNLSWTNISTPLADFDIPLLLQIGGMDGTTPPADSESVWTQASNPRAQMTLTNAGHFTFSDMCSLDAGDIEVIAELGVAEALDDGCTDENTDPEIAGAAIRHFAIGFFNVYLRDSAPTLDLLTQDAGEAIAGDLMVYEADL